MAATDDVTLGEVGRKLDAFAQSITTALGDIKADIRDKADRSQFDRLEGRFDSLEGRTERLEEWRHDEAVASSVHRQRTERTWKRWQRGVAGGGATIGIIAAVTDAVLRALGH